MQPVPAGHKRSLIKKGEYSFIPLTLRSSSFQVHPPQITAKSIHFSNVFPFLFLFFSSFSLFLPPACPFVYLIIFCSCRRLNNTPTNQPPYVQKHRHYHHHHHRLVLLRTWWTLSSRAVAAAAAVVVISRQNFSEAVHLLSSSSSSTAC